MEELVGVAEIAKMLGVTRQRVNAIVKTHPEFPAPAAELSAGRIWYREQIIAWSQQTERRRPETES